MIIEKTGDIWTSDADLIGHGVNVRGVMGAGIAKQVREQFPHVYDYYKDSCDKGEIEPGTVQLVAAHTDLIIANIASQTEPGADASYSLLTRALANLFQWAALSGDKPSIALPQIGCGIGGLEWDVTKQIIEGLSNAFELDIEVWTYASTKETV